MTLLRSIAFQFLFYANLSGQMILYLPVFFFLPEPARWWVVKSWSRSSLWLLHHVAGTRSVLTGQERIPAGPAIVAAKHQSFWEVISILPHLEKPTFILKKELMRIPVFGWYAYGLGMIPVDRKRRGAVLPSLLAAARVAVTRGRQIIIFPEGTRAPPGAVPNYRPGIHFLYAELGLPVVPVALNSGLYWPRQAVRREPGTIRAEFLELIPPGLKRMPFIATLRERIETRSLDFLRDAFTERPDLPMSPLVAERLAEAEAGFSRAV
ncbi:lysophospholipid acyltransferase family protein [Aureimonas pseudogalii]|uniref:1-acyl-sn-glycerol-3-phosphate acyltransferase n=1 Tax=Aureimonas pseudogalii TaxID=1744844 RepID=A0A7W6H1U1_9HYPH|nr:1-acyl-sn-glycerol-3-phosphate acyltransferase [Aureimonas pseudogalii]MBB3996271.1 1-acyl-sn-glycerol-3-phosphate acyltransferase [Aureimonas pseudogalii]